MLTTKQKKYLKSLAHHLTPVFQVGKEGVSDTMIHGIKEAMEYKELMKIRILDNCPSPKQEVALDLSAGVKAEIVQIIGGVIVLYKPSKTHRTIDLSLA